MESRDPGWYARFGSVIEKYNKSIYRESPVFWWFEPTPEGNFLIYGNDDRDTGEVERWLIGTSGRILGSHKSDVQAVVISEHFIFFVRQDEDYNITAYALKRSGTEREDFARLAGLPPG